MSDPEYGRAYRIKNRVRLSKEKKAYMRDPESIKRARAWRIKWNNANKHKIHAHYLLKKGMRYGLLSRPDHCTDCGLICKPHGHHEDYSKPLEVIWVCHWCHRLRHSRGPMPVPQS
jgi:hypothetical protein